MQELRERAKTRDLMKQFEILSEVEKLGQRPAQVLFTEVACDKKYPEEMRKHAIQRLGRKGDYDSLDTLLKLLKDDDSDIVQAAAAALEVTELPQATEPLLKLMKHKPSDVLRCTLLRALGACGGDETEVRSLLTQGTRDSNAYVRCCAALGLGYVVEGKKELDKTDREMVDLLLKVLGDNQWNVRGAAVYALGYARLAECKPQLEKVAQGDSSNDVRNCAQAALKNLPLEGPVDQELIRFRWKFSNDILR
jgi:HEAT repeat protein